MRNWIAGVMTALGSLLVLAGAAVVAARAAAAPHGDEPHHVPVNQPAMEVGADRVRASKRLLGVVRRVDAADRLIAWGIVLLVLGAATSGAISFQLGAASR